MQKLSIEDTLNILEYEKVRHEFRRRVIHLKKKRRVTVGEFVTLVFENRDTVLFQIQEMIRLERLVDDAQITDEIEIYNTFIPDAGELSATLFVEVQERTDLHSVLQRLVGLDEHVALQIGDRFVIRSEFESGHSTDDRISSMQYLRFSLTADQQETVRIGDEPVTIVIDHPHYQATETLSAETQAALAQDFC